MSKNLLKNTSYSFFIFFFINIKNNIRVKKQIYQKTNQPELIQSYIIPSLLSQALCGWIQGYEEARNFHDHQR